jgi:hypothetical protein
LSFGLVESDEVDLVRDVCLDIDKAQAKLARIQERLKTMQAEVEFLTAAKAERGDRGGFALNPGAKMKRWRRSYRKRNHQRLASHRRRLELVTGRQPAPAIFEASRKCTAYCDMGIPK